MDRSASPRCVIGTTAPAYSLGDLVRYAVRLGATGFGGPVALVGFMHRDLVERRQWISEAEFKEGLTLSQIMPGPLATQLAIYLGYVHHGVLGATLVGIAFVLPSFLMVLVLGWAYVAYGGLSWMQAVFYGVGAAVIGIVTISAWKLTQKTIGRDPLLGAIFLASAAATVVTETENVLLFLAAGGLVWGVRLGRRAPPAPAGRAIIPPIFGPAVFGPAVFGMTLPIDTPLGSLLGQIALFFTKAGAFVFGSGLAIVPFLYGGVVTEYGWLDDRQFLDAVAVAMITPGPVVITVGFIGYLVGARTGTVAAGVAGATVAALATFLPCYLFTIIPAPYFRRHGKRPGIVAFVDGVTAAAVGAIAGACVVLGRRTLFETDGTLETPKVVLLVVSGAILLRFKTFPEPLLIVCAAIGGLAIWPFLGR